MKDIFLSVALLLVINTFAFSQQEHQPKRSWPIKISILDESISVPNFWFTRYAYNPAAMIGTEYILKEKNKHDWHLTGNLGFYYHKNWQVAILLNSEIGYRYHFGRFNIAPRFGLGYAHSFATQEVYRYKDGTFQATKDYGNPSMMTSLALNLGYQWKDTPESPEVFLTFMSSVEIPLNFYTSMHQLIGLGFKFYL